MDKYVEEWLTTLGLEGYRRWIMEDMKIGSQDDLIALAKSGSKVRHAALHCLANNVLSFFSGSALLFSVVLRWG
jgi:hypothetical protein